MKRLVIILILALSVFCLAADNATDEWIVKGDNPVLKIAYSDVSAAESHTIRYSGFLTRVVIKSTAADADGDVKIVDISDANVASFVNKLGTRFTTTSVLMDYVVESTTQNSNIALGVPVAGFITVVLTDCADMGASTIYLYFSGKKD